MGQQQLLLLVLAIVIVGIATVAGIQAFSEGKDKADQDAAVSDAMRLITDIQAWNLKPAAFGGGNGLSDFTNVSFRAIGIDPADDAGADNTLYETQAGCFALTAGSDASIDIYLKDGQTCLTASIATVTVTGSDPSDVTWQYN